MATIIRYVNTDAAGGGDGTTNGTGAGGTNAFASVSAAEAALRQDLTGVTCDVADEQGNNYIALDILCSGTAADTTAVDFNSASWVTDATHRLRVRLNGTGAGAKWDSGLYRLVGSPGYGVPMIYVTSGICLTLQDLQVESQSTLDNAPHAFRANDFGYNVHIVGGFYRTTSTTGTPDDPMTFVVRPNTGTAKLYMSNVTIVAATGPAFDILNTTSATFEVYAYNCTMVCRAGTGSVFGFTLNASPTSRFKNLLLQSAAGSNYSVGNAAATETATILTQDATSPTVGLRSKTLTFVDATNWDYHLTSSDTDAIGAGTDLSADTYYSFSDDGDGITRTAPWDVGADQYVGESFTRSPGKIHTLGRTPMAIRPSISNRIVIS